MGAGGGRDLVVAIPLFHGLAALDAVGPYQVLQLLPRTTIVFVGDTAGQTSTLGICATHSYNEVPNPDVLLVPGGPHLPLTHKPLLDWISKAHETSLYTTSVCTGSLLLGAAGILNGVEAATHWSSYEQLAAYGAKVTDKRVVQQGKIITAAGVSAGIDMALKLASLLTDEETARAIQLLIEYDPQPPFDAGSVPKAGPTIVAKAHQLHQQSVFLQLDRRGMSQCILATVGIASLHN